MHTYLVKVYLSLAIILLFLSSLSKAAPIPLGHSRTKSAVSLQDEICHEGHDEGFCYVGLNPIEVLIRLEADVNQQLNLLDECFAERGDPKIIIARLGNLIQAASAVIGQFKIKFSGLLAGQAFLAFKIYTKVLLSIMYHCAEWRVSHESSYFTALLPILHDAEKTLTTTCGGYIGKLIANCVVVFNSFLQFI
ncbi:hypothetical protein RSOLAG1IB_08890 [Rhizoctonia solani AG-1 IB]|uniref:Uncharacterized protein n=1 Tax=Thanatephorus cucumeris (strain AG1-IB / isolate 7/3/14) TaxID=1108050 RepID=A0A0B7FMD6_THACB|nr:hypothetical protein RSOLAG1IB_08890 [Rhizoctonia solani AG-1 IB]